MITVRVLKDGDLFFNFRGDDKRFDGKRFPLWIDYASISIDGKEILSSVQSTWHDKPFSYKMKVKDGQIVIVKIKQILHNYTRNELKETILKLNENSDYITCNIEKILLDIRSKCEQMPSYYFQNRYKHCKDNFLTQPARFVRLADLSKNSIGHLQIELDGVVFESILLPSKVKKLYIFLAAATGKDINYPIFHRISWCDDFDGYCLYIDDPTRNINHFNGPCYYFGSEKRNFLTDIENIIRKVTSIFKIKKSDIIFISSSNGGFASMYLADKFPKSKCIVLNPQVDILTNTPHFKEFFCKEKIENCDSRLNLISMLKKTKSKIFIFSNVLCKADLKQMEVLFQRPISEDFMLIDIFPNVRVLCAKVPNKDLHLAQPKQYFCKFIEETIERKIDKQLELFFYLWVGDMRQYFWIESKWRENEKQ